MKFNRKDFLKLAGATTALGLGGKAAGELISTPELTASPAASSSADTSKVRWGMAVDMSKCPEGCNDCVSACRTEHNLPDWENPKHEIKWIWKEKFSHLFTEDVHEFAGEERNEKPFLTLCNHCKNPPCVRVCPTQATFKSEKDGLVMMDFHRCIGCRFCMAGCPYGSRSFNFRDPRVFFDKDGDGVAEVPNQKFPTRTRGVVEKCNFCAERLKVGKNPACVDVCKNGALVFGDLNDPTSEIRKVLKNNYTVRRKSDLGTEPNVFYLMD